MSLTATGMLPVLRENWTSDTIQKQFEDGNGPTARIEKIKGTTIGKQAQVPIHKGRNLAGYTVVGAGGGSLNAAGSQQIDQATYTLAFHWLSISLDASALSQASGNTLQSIIGAKDLEIENGVENVRHQVTRQLMTNGDGIVAACATGGSSNTVSLVASPSGTAYGHDALVRGWLGVQSVVDIGTTGDTDVIASGVNVTGIDDTATAPTITIDGSAVSTTAGTHFVYVKNPNSSTLASPEINGLRNIVNTTGALGGLNPATGGQEFWKAASRDTTTTALSLDLALSLSRQVMQRTGKPQSDVWTGLKQAANLYSLLQNQVRFTSDTATEAGSMQTVRWMGQVINAFPDVLDSDWYCMNVGDLCRITGATDGPQWATDMDGSGGSTQWQQGTTAFNDAVMYPIQIGAQRRNGMAAATALTA